MFERESPSQETAPIKNNLEIDLGSENELLVLKNWLENFLGAEAVDQFVFVLKTMAGEDFGNHCNDATQEFGRRLNTRFGDEESFFDIAPDANFYDVKSQKPLTKTSYVGDFHSVGVIELKNSNEQTISLSIDLTYNVVSASRKDQAILVMNSQGEAPVALESLNSRYGGQWEINYKFNKENNKFVFQD